MAIQMIHDHMLVLDVLWSIGLMQLDFLSCPSELIMGRELYIPSGIPRTHRILELNFTVSLTKVTLERFRRQTWTSFKCWATSSVATTCPILDRTPLFYLSQNGV